MPSNRLFADRPGKASKPGPVRLIIGAQASSYLWLPVNKHAWRCVRFGDVAPKAKRPTLAAILLYPDNLWHAVLGSGDPDALTVTLGERYCYPAEAMKAAELAMGEQDARVRSVQGT